MRQSPTGPRPAAHPPISRCAGGATCPSAATWWISAGSGSSRRGASPGPRRPCRSRGRQGATWLMKGDLLSTAGNRALLHQGVTLLGLLSDALYAEPRGAWAPVGAQYRHILEHYRSFFSGLGQGRMDYDARARDERIERSRHAALAATREGLAALQPPEGAPDPPVTVQMDSGR